MDLFRSKRKPGEQNHLFLELLFGLAVLNSFWIGIYGYQQVSLQVALSGLIFVPLMYASDKLSGGQIFKAPGSFAAMSFSLTVPLTIMEVLRFLFSSNNLFSTAQGSFFSLPSQGFYASILKGMLPSGVAQFNGFLAPVYESAAVVAVTLICYRSLRQFFTFLGLPRTTGGVLAAVLGPLPGAVIFALFHPLSHGLVFMLVAIVVVVYLPTVPVLLEDVTGQTLLPVVGLGIGTIAGWHMGINIAQMGGLLAWSGTVLSGRALAQSPALFFTGVLSVGFIAVAYLASAWYVMSLGGTFRVRDYLRGVL